MRERGPTTTRALVGSAFLASILLSVLSFVPAPASAITTLAVVSPAGDEVWSGGSAHDVVWDLGTDSSDTVRIDYLLDGTPYLIETRGPLLLGRYTTAWTLPTLDHGNVTAGAAQQSLFHGR